MDSLKASQLTNPTNYFSFVKTTFFGASIYATTESCLDPQTGLAIISGLIEENKINHPKHTDIIVKIAPKHLSWAGHFAHIGYRLSHILNGELFMTSVEHPVPIGTHSPGINVMLTRGEDNQQEVLLVEEINMPGKLKNVSGCVEAHQTEIQTVIREVKEETGYDIAVKNDVPQIQFLGVMSRPSLGRLGTDDLIFCFTAKIDSHDAPNIDPKEIASAVWVPNDTLLNENYNGKTITTTTRELYQIYWKKHGEKNTWAQIKDWIVPTGDLVFYC